MIELRTMMLIDGSGGDGRHCIYKMTDILGGTGPASTAAR